jgi:hypothetical protein
MLEIKLTKKGYVANEKISPNLFEPIKNIIVRVICEQPYYAGANTLENETCKYINSCMPKGIEVKTDYVTVNENSSQNDKGKYIEELKFQLYIS